MDGEVLERHHIDAVGREVGDVQHAARFIQRDVASLPADGHHQSECAGVYGRDEPWHEQHAQRHEHQAESHFVHRGSKESCAVHKTSRPRKSMDISPENNPVNVALWPQNAIAKMGSIVFLPSDNRRNTSKRDSKINRSYSFKIDVFQLY